VPVWLTRIVIALAALVVIDALRFADPDLFVTLYSGREIAAHHGPPKVDTASFSVAGQPWNDYEWLARWAAYETASRFGDRGLVLGRLVVIAVLLATIVGASASAGGGALSLALAVTLFMLTAGRYLLFRPTLVTFAAVTLLFAAVERWRRGARWPMWLILLAIPVWTNLHAGFALGIVLLGILVAAGVADAGFPALRRAFAPALPWRQSVPCLAAATALTGLHPLGYRVWDAVLGTLGGRFTPSLSEWRPLHEFGARQSLPVYALMLAILVALLIGHKRVTLFETASAAVLGVAAIVRVRFVPLFSLCAVLVLVRALPAVRHTALGRRAAEVFGRVPRVVAPALAIVALVAVVTTLGVSDLRIRKVPYLTPVPATKFLQENRLDGRVFTEYDWGGYVRWKIPAASIFVDGRSDTVYPLPVIEDWARVVNAGDGWRDILERYRAQIVVLRSDQLVVPQLEKEAGWVPAYADPFACIFVRDDTEHSVFVEALRAGRVEAPAVTEDDYLGL
jgi:hypothetical protein